MKNSVILMFVCIQFSQAAFAEGFFDNLGQGLMDVVTLGQAGRDRDKAFEEKLEEITKLTRQHQTQQRQAQIDMFNANIKAATVSRDVLIKNKNNGDQIYAGLNQFSELLVNQMAANLQIESLADQAATSRQELAQDLNTIRFVVDQISNAEVRLQVVTTLISVAQSRGLSVQDFIVNTLKLSQKKQANLTDLVQKITLLLPQYKAYQAEQDSYIQQQQEIINTNVSQLNKLNAAIEAEVKAAQQAAVDEANRIAKEQAQEARRAVEREERVPIRRQQLRN